MALKETILDRAQKFIQKGALDKAIIEYRAALDLDPRDFAIRLKIGDLYTKLNKKAEAVKEYTEVARANSQRGFYLKAIAVYKQVLKVDDTILDVHYKLAELYAKQRLLADAISEYSHIVNIFEKKGKTSEVMELLKKMSEVDPENVGVRLKLADLYQKLSFEKDALEQYFWIFDKLVSQGKLEKAEKIYLSLYSMYPSDHKILVGLAGLYRQKGDEDQYIRFSKGLLQFYRKSEDAQGANRVCAEILAVRPDEPESLAYLKAVKAAEQEISRKADEEKRRIEAELLAKQEAEQRARQEIELRAEREADARAREDAERRARAEADAKARAEVRVAGEEARKEDEDKPLIGFPIFEEESPAGKEEPLIAFPEHEIEISLEGFEDHIPVKPSEAGAGASFEDRSGEVSEGDEALVDIEIPGLDESELRFTPRVIIDDASFHPAVVADLLIETVSAEAPHLPQPQAVEPGWQAESIEEKIEKEEIEEALAEPGAPSESIDLMPQEPYAPAQAPEVHAQSPEVHAEAPEVHAEAPEVHAEAPEVHAEAPEVHVEVPEVHVEAPEVHVEAPEVHVEAPEVHVEAPEVHVEAPEVHVEAPEVHAQAPEVHAQAPEVHAQAPEVHAEAPEVHAEAPEVHAQAPEVHAEAPEVHAEAPEVHAEAPEVHAEAPEVHAQAPEVHAQAPEVHAQAPEVHAEEPLIFIDDLEFKTHIEPAKTPLSEFDIHFKEIVSAPVQDKEEEKEGQEPILIFPHAEEEVVSEPEEAQAHAEHGAEESLAPGVHVRYPHEAAASHEPPDIDGEKPAAQPPEGGPAQVVEVFKEAAGPEREAAIALSDVEAPAVHLDEHESEMPEAEEDLSAAFSELMEKMGEVHEPVVPVPVISGERPGAQSGAASGPDEMIVESERAEGGGGKKDEYVDLSAELGMEEAIEDLTGSWEGAASRESFDEFKSGMGQQLNREDSETHFNLGIAYMEMELFSEAVNEFKVAMKDPRLEFDCYIRLGHCAMAQADPADAIVYYLKGLKIEGAAEQERKGMMYELALAYEAAGENDEAAQIFRSIYAIDPEFREVGEKVRMFSMGTQREVPLIPLDDGLIEVELL